MSITSAAVDRFDRVDDLLPVVAAGGVDDDVAQARLAVDLDEVDGAHDAAGVADRAGDLPEHAGSVVELDADREAILGARRGAHGNTCSPVVGGSAMLGGISRGTRVPRAPAAAASHGDTGAPAAPRGLVECSAMAAETKARAGAEKRTPAGAQRGAGGERRACS